MALAWDVIAATGLRNDDDEHERAIHRAPGSGAAPGPGHVPSLGAGDSGTDRWPGFGPPLHLHRDAAEAFFVLQGEYLMFLEDRQQLCPPGSFVYVPAGTPHTFKVTSTAPGTKLNLFSPAAMVGFFEELAIAELSGGATLERLGEIAEQNHMEVLGPVPQTYL
jgi:mannose-6-phosphate isomerase-like protein (cupin superfamily)